MARLRRESDGAGDEGSMSLAISFASGKQETVGHRPILGCSIIVGSVTARSYSNQDWWMTTEVTEILIDEPDYVKFKTLNSTYEWWK